MAGTSKKKKKKHGKIEKKKSAPFLQFKLGVLLLLIVLSFGGTFGVYMLSASSDPDYWQNEIVGSSSAENTGTELKNTKNKKAVTNPVPLSERAEDTRMETSAFIGEFSPLTAYYNTKTEFVFTDSITGMSESRMNSISRNVTETKAIYLWYGYPNDAEATLSALKNLVTIIQNQHNKPVYLLNVIPDADAEQSRKIDEWNTQLFAFCDSYGVHYVDINTSLKKDDGTLAGEYENDETLYKAIGELILTHVAD